jgi:hypothetical protein
LVSLARQSGIHRWAQIDVGVFGAAIQPDRAIEIEFAAGARMRITVAVDAVTLKAAVAAPAGGRSR